MRVLVLVLVLAGCSTRTLNIGTLGASSALLACDWVQTRSVASRGWSGFAEQNPVLGASPETRTVDAYFLSTLVINVALWSVLPQRYRSIVPAVVTVAQMRTIRDNVPYTGHCL